MKRVVVLALSLLLLASCRPPDDAAAAAGRLPAGIQGRLELGGPARTGPAPVTVYLLDGGEGISGASVSVTGDMTHAGMVPVIAQAPESAPGEYVADEFAFNMGGDWMLLADVRLADGTQFELNLPVSVSSGN